MFEKNDYKKPWGTIGKTRIWLVVDIWEVVLIFFFFNVKFIDSIINFVFFVHVACGTSLARDWTHAPCIGSMVS